jgi:hypothetical protein
MQLVSPLTIDDFERLPDELAYYHELVDGELVDVSGNILGNHNRLRDLLIMMLLFYVKNASLAVSSVNRSTILEVTRMVQM